MTDGPIPGEIVRAKGILDGAATLADAASKARQFAFRLEVLAGQGWQLREPVADDYGLVWKPGVVPPGAMAAEVAAMPLRDLMPRTKTGTQAWHSLSRERIRTVGDVLVYTAAELLVVPNFGPRSLRIVVQVLAEYGLALLPPGTPPEGRARPVEEAV